MRPVFSQITVFIEHSRNFQKTFIEHFRNLQKFREIFFLSGNLRIAKRKS